MDRRTFLNHGLVLSLGLSAPLVYAQSSTSARTPRILMITFRGETDVEKGFRASLRSAGVNADILSRDVNRDVKNVGAILKAAVEFKPDLIYTWGTPVTLEVTGTYAAPKEHALSHVPVVFVMVAAPLRSLIVPSLAGHKRNITGAVHVVPTDVQMRAIQSYKPATKIGVLYTSTEQNSKAIVADMRDYGKRSNVQVIERTFALDAAGRPTADGMESLIADIRREGAQWLYLLPDTFSGSVHSRITPAALAEKMPTFAATENAMRAGGALVGLVCRYTSVGQLAAAKAIDILVHGKPATSLPVETLKRFSLIVNMRVAHALGGVYPPLEMLNYAEIINPGQAGLPQGSG